MTPAQQIAGCAVMKPGTTSAVIAYRYSRALECGDEIAAAIPPTMISRRVRGVGQESIELNNGSRILQRTATKGGARGYSLAGLWLDGPISEGVRMAALPTLAAARGLLVES